MADTFLSNVGSADGLYDSIPTALISEAVSTLLIEGLTITKAADKDAWASGVLTYTVNIENNAENDYTDVSFIDDLDTTVINLVTDSVKVDGVDTTYTFIAGKLTVDLPDIAPGGSTVITFEVTKV